jgi:hypothetical protein
MSRSILAREDWWNNVIHRARREGVEDIEVKD